MEVAPTVVPVESPTDVADARRRIASLAVALGFDEIAVGRVAIAVTELGTNLVKHAGGGEIHAVEVRTGDTLGIQILGIDRGRGIANLSASLRDGVSTAGTSGTGLGAIRRAADSFDIFTSAAGTVIAAGVYPAKGCTDVGAVSVPAPGEVECGDAWAAWSAGELRSLLMVDGLGHGQEAAKAARAAVAAFRLHAERPCGQVVSIIHEALRGTRGAAVALAEMDARQGTLRFCGIGNIAAAIVPPDGKEQHLVSLSGIAGHMMRRVQEFSYQWPAGSTLIVHSDGLGTHWSMARYPGLIARDAAVIAGVLYRDHRRGRDDVTVAVTHNKVKR